MSINKYNKAMQFLLRPKYIRDDVILQEDSNEPLVARAGFEEGTKLTDYVEANISGNTGSSTPGEGVKINNETFNGVLPYLIFAALSIVTFIFVWRLVPETKGKTLEELEAIWTGEKVFHNADEIEPDQV